MNPRPFVYLAGIVLLVLGLCGFVPPLVEVEEDPLRVAAGVGGRHLCGLYPVTYALSALHTLIGGWALWSGMRLARSVRFARRAAFVFALLLILGTIPGTDTFFGAAPLYGNNLLLHGMLALLSFLFGWLYRKPQAVPAAELEPAA